MCELGRGPYYLVAHTTGLSPTFGIHNSGALSLLVVLLVALLGLRLLRCRLIVIIGSVGTEN